MIILNNIAVGNDWKWIFRALFPRPSIHCPKYTLFNLQFTIYKDTFSFYKDRKCVKNTLILMPEL
jgi:hypothetical protein